ncbi:MAG TPA: phospholipid carrier-dependent glycosyltransferase, partial [Bryobacteraceae bacterium]|nr:phospholipid carrier-dependent glycosyltransferase [Bryobacteraceae bacterium]
AGAALLREPRATVVVAILFAACYCAGRALCDRCGWSIDAPAADLVMSTSAGFALLNTALFASGLARLWYPWFFALLLLAPILMFHRHLLRLANALRAIFRRWGELKDLQDPLSGILMPFAAILAACTTALMLAPTVSWDAMKMHLPLAQYYLQVHGLEPKPHLDYAFFPQTAESIFALAWSLGGQPAAQLIAPLFFALTLVALWVLARDCGADSGGALAGVMLAASLPVLHWAESVPKNDSALTFFMLTSLLAAVRWRAGSEFKWVQAGVLFLACGLATKDPALFGAIPLGAVFLYAAWRQPRRLRALASLVGIFAAVALVWNARRFALTGNPIFPLAPGQSTVPGWPPDPSFGGTILRILRLPWDLHVHGHDFSDTVLIAPLGIVFAVLWPVWPYTRRLRWKREERLCLGFAIAAFLLWGWLSPVARYALAPLAVMAMLTGVRLVWLWRSSTRIIQASLAIACVWVLIPAVCAVMIVEINLPQLRYLAGAIGRDNYLTQASYSYAPLAWLRDHTTPAERVLGLENCSDLYAPPFPRYQSYCAYRPWTAPEIESRLRTATFHWLLAPPGDQQAVRATGRSAVEMYRDPHYVIYRLD